MNIERRNYTLNIEAIRSESDTGDRPGVHDRHFWLAEYTASMSHSSTSTGEPPSDVTASTIASAL